MYEEVGHITSLLLSLYHSSLQSTYEQQSTYGQTQSPKQSRST